jgi:hypothetical protein
MRYLISELTYEKESFYENILYFLPNPTTLLQLSKQINLARGTSLSLLTQKALTTRHETTPLTGKQDSPIDQGFNSISGGSTRSSSLARAKGYG